MDHNGRNHMVLILLMRSEAFLILLMNKEAFSIFDEQVEVHDENSANF